MEPTIDPQPTLNRRHLLAGALAAGSAAALAGAPGAFATSPGDASKTKPLPAVTFFEEPALNFQMLFALGGAGYGVSEVGEVLAAFDRIHGKGDSYGAVFEEFLRLGRQVRKRADEDRKAGRTASARSGYLRAAMYLDQALFFALGSGNPTRKHEGALYREMEGAWASAGALFKPRFEPVRIPYAGRHLPGWMLKAGKGKRPTVILNTGSDAQNIDMYVYGGAAALERGWNALIFEGPGQGSNLFLRNEAFVPDWERVITPVVDFLRGRPRRRQAADLPGRAELRRLPDRPRRLTRAPARRPRPRPRRRQRLPPLAGRASARTPGAAERRQEGRVQPLLGRDPQAAVRQRGGRVRQADRDLWPGQRLRQNETGAEIRPHQGRRPPRQHARPRSSRPNSSSSSPASRRNCGSG